MNEENNPWTPPITGKLISPFRTPNTETPKGEDIEDLLNKSLSKPYGGTSNLRFGPDSKDNPF